MLHWSWSGNERRSRCLLWTKCLTFTRSRNLCICPYDYIPLLTLCRTLAPAVSNRYRRMVGICAGLLGCVNLYPKGFTHLFRLSGCRSQDLRVVAETLNSRRWNMRCLHELHPRAPGRSARCTNNICDWTYLLANWLNESLRNSTIIREVEHGADRFHPVQKPMYL